MRFFYFISDLDWYKIYEGTECLIINGKKKPLKPKFIWCGGVG
jgi:hypothetical protein